MVSVHQLLQAARAHGVELGLHHVRDAVRLERLTPASRRPLMFTVDECNRWLDTFVRES